MIAISLMDLYPAVTEMGYECEMQFTDDTAALGSFSQVYCWIAKKTTPWTVCKYNAIVSFASEFMDQVGLFFGLVLMSSPKPSISYVRITRYLVMFQLLESILRLPFYAAAYAKGSEFMKSSSSCIFEVSSDQSDTSQMITAALKGIIYEGLSIVFYAGYVWGTFMLIPVLKRGGTGDERVAGEDVLALVRRDPPKLLVLSSAFSIAPLRIASIILCLALVGMCLYNGFTNLLRMVSWCGAFGMEKTWCRWPYGILSLIDQSACIFFSLYTTSCLVFLRPDQKFPPLSIFWAYITFSSFVFLIGSIYIVSQKYPSYWLSGMRSDLWIYYTRFWFGVNLVVFMRSISIIRVAKGVGTEDERGASDLIYANLSDKGGSDENGKNVSDDDADSLSDLLGLTGPTVRSSTRLVEPAKGEWTSESPQTSSRDTSPLGTPVMQSQSVGPIPSQAVDRG